MEIVFCLFLILDIERKRVVCPLLASDGNAFMKIHEAMVPANWSSLTLQLSSTLRASVDIVSSLHARAPILA